MVNVVAPGLAGAPEAIVFAQQSKYNSVDRYEAENGGMKSAIAGTDIQARHVADYIQGVIKHLGVVRGKTTDPDMQKELMN